TSSTEVENETTTTAETDTVVVTGSPVGDVVAPVTPAETPATEDPVSVPAEPAPADAPAPTSNE
ncbi:MAG: hypothetical protein WCJ59_01440, partial [bacterium]